MDADAILAANLQALVDTGEMTPRQRQVILTERALDASERRARRFVVHAPATASPVGYFDFLPQPPAPSDRTPPF